MLVFYGYIFLWLLLPFKLAFALLDCNYKDELMTKHENMTLQATEGREKAGSEAEELQVKKGEEIGYDGWRQDFARGFWGGYVKDYMEMEASEPYFAVGEYWDSLSYTYGEMDHNQDAHRQRTVDWINATNGIAGGWCI